MKEMPWNERKHRTYIQTPRNYGCPVTWADARLVFIDQFIRVEVKCLALGVV